MAPIALGGGAAGLSLAFLLGSPKALTAKDQSEHYSRRQKNGSPNDKNLWE